MREEGDPECAPRDEIETWLKTKRLYIEMINSKIDFTSYESETMIR